jgi:hypothetical protein
LHPARVDVQVVVHRFPEETGVSEDEVTRGGGEGEAQERTRERGAPKEFLRPQEEGATVPTSDEEDGGGAGTRQVEPPAPSIRREPEEKPPEATAEEERAE